MKSSPHQKHRRETAVPTLVRGRTVPVICLLLPTIFVFYLLFFTAHQFPSTQKLFRKFSLSRSASTAPSLRQPWTSRQDTLDDSTWPYHKAFDGPEARLTEWVGHRQEQSMDWVDAPAEPSRGYLAYNTHSQFNNQRSALQNAFIVASLLNRTLVVPRCYLGHDAAAPWVGSNHSYPLEERIAHLDGNFTLNANWSPGNATGLALPCHVLMNLDAPRVPFIDVDEFRREYASWSLKAKSSTLHIPDKVRREYRLTDMPREAFDHPHLVERALRNGSFRALLPLRRLARLSSQSHPLIHFNTFYGINLLHLSSPQAVRTKKKVEKRLVLANPAILATSGLIVKILGGQGTYSAAHFRSGDGPFSRQSQLLAKAMTNLLITSIGKDYTQLGKPSDPTTNKKSGKVNASGRTLYLATDAPSDHPNLEEFRKQYGQFSVLGDWLEDIRPIISGWWRRSATKSVKSKPSSVTLQKTKLALKSSELELAAYAYPFIEQLVCSQARYFVGTAESTFSEFIITEMIVLNKGGRAVMADANGVVS